MYIKVSYFCKSRGVFLPRFIPSQMTLQCVVSCVIVGSELILTDIFSEVLVYFSKYISQGVFLAQIISSQMTLQDVVRCVIVFSELQCLRQSLVSRSASTLTSKCNTNIITLHIQLQYKYKCNPNTNTTKYMFSVYVKVWFHALPPSSLATNYMELHMVVKMKRVLQLCGSRVWLMFQPTTKNCIWLSK